MPEQAGYRDIPQEGIRVLLCFGVTQSFFDAAPDRIPVIVERIREAFDDLGGRFGVTVLGTFDDDELQVGASVAYPWTAYILLDAPDLAAVTAITNLVRATAIEDARMWKYMRVEARVGRPLFFGTS